MKSIRLIPGSLLLLVLATAAFAEGVEPQTQDRAEAVRAECARVELLRFAEELAAVPGMEMAGEDARRALATVPTEILIPLHASLEPVQGWQQLPGVIAEMTRQVEIMQQARVKRAIDEAINGPSNDSERLRGDLLLFVSMLRSFSPIAPDLGQHLDFLESRIQLASAAEMDTIRTILSEQAKAFQEDIHALRTENPELRAALRPEVTGHSCSHICEDDPFGICDAICGAVVSAFNAVKSTLESAISGLQSTINSLTATLNGYIAQFNNLVSQVTAFANQVAQFVTDAFNAAGNMINQLATIASNIGATFQNLWNQIGTAVTGFFNDLIALVPTSPEAAFNLLTGINLSDTSWVNTLLSRFPVLEAPCPAFGTNVGPLGTVGTLAAAQKSDGIAKLTKIFYDAAPSDTAGIKVKLIAASIYHPAEYWNLCARSRYAIHEYEEETAHRQHQTTNLNVALSTRGTQVSVDALGASVAALDGQIAGGEGKIDLLPAKNDELLRRLDQNLSTRVRQTSVDDLRGTIGVLDRDVAKVEAKLDLLHANVAQEARNESDFQAAVAAFDQIILRLSVEDNLLGSNGSPASLYQLPEAFGGNLNLVRSIVEKTIAAMLATGQTTYNAQTELGRGTALVSVGDFAGAYKQFRKAYSDAVRP
jgi:hypothetical protein